MTEQKCSIDEVAVIVDNEGLDYAIQHYMNADSIENEELAALWTEARKTLKEIEAILYPNGLEAWHDQEPPEYEDCGFPINTDE